MIEARVTVRLDDLSQRIRRATLTVQQGLVVHVAEWLRQVIRGSFEKDSSPKGVPWQPWSLKYAAHGSGKGMLEKSGALFEQSTRAVAIHGNTITAGSTLKYAAIHQFGFDGDESVRQFIRRVRSPGRDTWGKIIGKNNKIVRGKIMMGVAFPTIGKHTRHKKMPARPYLPTPEFVETEGTKDAQDYVNAVLEELEGK